MKFSSLNEVLKTPLKRFELRDGNVLRGVRCDDEGFLGFGEVYFSWINTGSIKAWKKHSKMIVNLVVPVGSIKLVCAERPEGPFKEFFVNENVNYVRITIPAGLWFGFKG